MIRKAVVDDVRAFNGLINSLGGTNLFRALFGQYNFTSIIEYSYLSLITILNDSSVCFASFSDGLSNSTENISFDYIIEEISQIMPCRVSVVNVIWFIIFLITCLCRQQTL
jgi:hypothetical protein